MLELLPFNLSIEPLTIGGAGVWAIALYLSFYPLSQWVIKQLNRWFNFAEQSLYFSTEEFEKTRPAREAQNAFWASVLSIIPFLILGGLLYYGVTLSLGQSWSVSVGMIAMIGSGVYELGRRDGRSS
jgi:hypothetical protein